MSDALLEPTVARLRIALKGRYELERRLGSGAMATVYLAEDLRHRRKVAVKVLQPEVAASVGADRFLTEIHTTANLQHPHILPLFDSGAADGVLFYVMPYIPGESLRQRLDREKQLPVQEAVAIARAVALALDYAHRRGVVHRDVTPANILLHDGQPMIADLGIALAMSSGEAGRLTGTGLSIGTPRYMSPEQAAGERAIDRRTDIYSLACVLYEMLTGQPPFDAASTHALVAQILTDSPVPLVRRRPAVPPHVASAVARALEKVPADRFDSAADFARALDDDAFRWPPSRASASAAAWPGRLAALVGLLVLAAAATVWSLTRPPSAAVTPPVRLAFTLPDDQILPSGHSWSVLEISPDGRRVVYVGQRGLQTQLYVREIDGFEIRALEGTDGAREPFFSPDGSWVAFFAGGRLRRVPASGGIAIDIASAPGIPYGGSWGEDGTILYSLSGSNLWRVPADGGTPVEIPLVMAAGGGSAGQDGGEGLVAVPAPIKWPFVLRGGTHALAAVGWRDDEGRPNNAGLAGVIDLATGEFRTLFPGSRPRYVDSGHIVFDAGVETISVVPFDLERLRVTGTAVPIANDAKRSAGSGTNFSVSRSGTLAYPRGGFDRTLVYVDRSGGERPLNLSPRGYRLPSVSPDGRYVAVTVDPQPPRIWMVNLERESASPLTTEGYNLAARWMRDGSAITFTRTNVDTPGTYSVRWPDGEPLELLYAGEGRAHPLDDGRLLVDSWAGDLELFDPRDSTTEAFMATSARERQPALSPDGNWVAYTSDITGVDEVYVAPLSGASAPTPISSGGGAEPRWAADGSELFFRSGYTIFAVPTRTQSSFEVGGVAQALFSGPYDFTSGVNWDVLPGGGFIFVKANPSVGREIRLLLNWLDDPRGGRGTGS